MNTLNNFIELFDALEQEAIYDYLMEAGSQGDFPEHLKTNENFVNGCQSQVWIFGYRDQGKLRFVGTSDSFMVRGIVYLICHICNELNERELDDVNWQMFSPLGKHFSTQRRKGMQSIINKIRAIIRGNK